MNELLAKLTEALNISPTIDMLGRPGGEGKNYDPEMLYVECRHCGKPVLWEPGRTTAILLRSHVKPEFVDEHCMIISDGCRECMPQAEGYALSIVRLAGLNMQDLILMNRTGGHA